MPDPLDWFAKGVVGMVSVIRKTCSNVTWPVGVRVIGLLQQLPKEQDALVLEHPRSVWWHLVVQVLLLEVAHHARESLCSRRDTIHDHFENDKYGFVGVREKGRSWRGRGGDGVGRGEDGEEGGGT